MKKAVEVYKEYPLDESMDCHKVGHKGVVDIVYHEPAGEGDAHYCDVIFDSKVTQRIFRPDSIVMEEI